MFAIMVGKIILCGQPRNHPLGKRRIFSLFHACRNNCIAYFGIEIMTIDSKLRADKFRKRLQRQITILIHHVQSILMRRTFMPSLSGIVKERIKFVAISLYGKRSPMNSKSKRIIRLIPA